MHSFPARPICAREVIIQCGNNMIYDCFSFAGEYDMLEIRLNILSKYVDKFIIVEGTETFSGKPKPLYFINSAERFKQWDEKIIYSTIPYNENFLNDDIAQQINERNYIDAPAFKRAFYQKEMLRKVLEDLNLSDEDIIFYGDVDEIWNPLIIEKMDGGTHKLRQLAYSYYLNNRSPEDWRGTIITRWKNLKNSCLNDMRANPTSIWEDGGWHFTNLGGIYAIKNKIISYDHQEVNIPLVIDGIEERFNNNEDFLGRGFRFWVEDKDLPSYILENKDRYSHLWKK